MASNPFLRPGSNRPPPKVNTPPPPPKPLPNPAFANEVEFRGYFLLKGIPHFCIFNKKANFGEWIKLTEKTYEEFQAQAFDLESETLTLAFNGQNFTLTLEQSKNSGNLPNASSSLPKVTLPSNSSASTSPRVMPPRPKSAPKLPEWLASRVSSRASSVPASPNPSRSRGAGMFLHPEVLLFLPIRSEHRPHFSNLVRAIHHSAILLPLIYPLHLFLLAIQKSISQTL